MRRVVRGTVLALLSLVGLAAAAAIALLLWVRSDGGRAWVKQVVLSQAQRALPGLEIGSIGGDFSRSIVVQGLVVRDRSGRPALQAQRVAVRFDLLGLLRHRVAVEELALVGVRVQGRPLQDGRLNLTELVVAPQASSERAPSDWTIEVARVWVRDLAFDIATPGGRPPRRGRITELEGAARLEGAAVRAQVHALGAALEDGGRPLVLELSARAELSRAAVRVDIERAALWGLTPRGAVTLVGQAQGPRSAVHGNFRVHVPPRGALALTGVFDLSAPSGPRYQVQVTLSRVDPHVLARSLQPGALSARLEARGQSVPLSAGSSSEIALELGPSALEGVPVRSARIDLSSQGTRWQLRGATVRAPGALVRAQGRGSLNRIALELDATLDAVGMRRLPIRQLPPGLRGRGRLQARLSAPLPPSPITLEGRAWVSDLALGKSLRVGAASLAAQITIEKARPHGVVHIDARGLTLSSGLALDVASARVQADGSNLQVEVSGRGPRGSGQLQAHGTLEPDRAHLIVERFDLEARRQKLALRGPAQVRWQAGDAIQLTDLRVSARGEALSGDFDASVRYSLNPRRPERMLAQVAVRQGAFAELTAVDADLRAAIEREHFTATLDGTLGQNRFPVHLDVQVPLAPAQGLQLAARGPLRAHIFARRVPLQDLPLPLSLARRGVKRATLDLSAEVAGDISNPQLHADLAVLDAQWRDLGPMAAQVRLAADERATRLQARGQLGSQPVAALDASIPLALAQILDAARHGATLPDVPLELDAHIDRFDLSNLAKLSPQFSALSGQLDGSAHATGSLHKPTGQIDLALRNARFDRLGFGPVELHAKGDARRQVADLRMEQVPGGVLHAHAEADRTGPTPRMQATVTAHALDVSFLPLFSSAIREAGGKLDAELHAEGTTHNPALSGSARLSNGTLGPVGQPTIGGLQVALALSPQKLVLERLEARSGGGSLRGQGWLNLDGQPPHNFRLDLSAKQFVLAWNGIEGGRLDGDLHVRGAMEPHTLRAQLEVPRAQLWVPKLPSTRKLQSTQPHDDQLFVDRAGLAERQAQEAERAVDLSGQIGTFYVRGKDMDFEIEGNLRAQTTEEGQLVLVGALDVRRGFLNIQNQRYDIERAHLAWDGDPDHPDPRLDIKLTHVFAETAVTIELGGTPKKPELRLESDPAMDPSQIIGLILTGEAAGAPSDQRIDPAAAVSSLVLGKLADKIAPELGVDIIRIEQPPQTDQAGKATGETDTRVEVGKYITERVFLSYVHIFGANEQDNRNEARVEYRMTRSWLLQTTFGDAGVGGLDVFWTYRY